MSGLTSTAGYLEVASVPIQAIKLTVPSREELAAHTPTLAELEEETLARLSEVHAEISSMQAAVALGEKANAKKNTVLRRLIGTKKIAKISPPRRRSVVGERISRNMREREVEEIERFKKDGDSETPSGAVSALGLVGLPTGDSQVGPGMPPSHGKGGRGRAADDDDEPDRRASTRSHARDKFALSEANRLRDALVGRFNALEQLRSGTHMPPLTVPGDPHVIDEAWNNSLVSADANAAPTGRFCAYCAQRAPPVLSRHRFTECMFRQLAGRPEFSQAAIEQLEEELSQKTQRTMAHIGRFHHVVEKRKRCKAALEQTTYVIRFMRHFTRQPQAAPLPLMGPPKVLRPLCHPKWNEETFATTFIASRMAGDAARRFQGVYDTEDIRAFGMRGVCEQFKAILLMTPRRSLLHGGLQELKSEEARAELEAIKYAREPSDADDASTASDLSRPTTVRVSSSEGDPLSDGRTLSERAAHVKQKRMSAPAPPSARAAGGGEERDSLSALGTARKDAYKRKQSAPSTVGAPPQPGRPPNRPLMRRGSVSTSLWRERQNVAEPMIVREAAQALGVELGGHGAEYHLMHVVLALVSAPLPADWQEILRGGRILFLDESTGHTQEAHPLTPHFQHVVSRLRSQRKVGARRTHPKVPPFLAHAAERWVQFVDADGAIFFYDFATGAHAKSFEAIIDRLLHEAKLDGFDPTPWMDGLGVLIDPASRQGANAKPIPESPKATSPDKEPGGGGGGGGVRSKSTDLEPCSSPEKEKLPQRAKSRDVDEEPAKSNGFTNDEAAKVAAGRKAEVERQVKAEAETASKKQPKRRFSVADVTDLVSETYKSETNYGVHSSNSKMDEVERSHLRWPLMAPGCPGVPRSTPDAANYP